MVLTDRERSVVALLAAGQTDERMAATLGLSRRTITYTLAELMQRFGVENRFQLGMVLTARGLVPKHDE